MAHIEFYQDESEKQEWRWRAEASNGQNIGKSTEGYSNRSDAENNLRAIPRMASVANIKTAAEGSDESEKPPVQFYEDVSNEWRWRVWAGNGQQIGGSEEGFSSKGTAHSNLDNLIEAINEWDSSDS